MRVIHSAKTSPSTLSDVLDPADLRMLVTLLQYLPVVPLGAGAGEGGGVVAGGSEVPSI